MHNNIVLNNHFSDKLLINFLIFFLFRIQLTNLKEKLNSKNKI